MFTFIFGRPPQGYNEIENQFYRIRLELDNSFEILTNNIDSFNRKFATEHEGIEKKAEQYKELVNKEFKEYQRQGEDSETAYSIAESEAANELKIPPYWFEMMNENLFLLQRESIDGYHKSSIVMMYTQIEFFFIKLCDILKDEIQSKLILKDLAGYSIIGTCLVYLEKVVGIKIDEGLKGKFLIYQKIRNNIIHDNSYLVDVDGKQIKPVLTQFKGAYFEYDNRYYINDISIVERFKKDTEKIIESIEAEVEKRIEFKTILTRMRTGFGNSLFERKDETVKIDGDKFVYSCIINRYTKKDETQKLTITIKKVSNSRKILDEKNSSFKIAPKEEFLKVFDNTAKNVIDIFKHYKSLINGRNSYLYTMLIESN